MRLKRVKIFGFKTFADRTEFDVEGDLTAVVGSNGCGKSNLVDAILWGLGEASPRHLRAATGTDVIFNGSAHRKPLGFAEVTLLFDNEDGLLPIDMAEVSVSRRLTRAGDSEYRINRAVCRQRDLFELFADSGLGRTGYAIVGQKEIDSALSASPEERRTWLDEAAGVQRYRARKVEAQRRLTAARTHLERTADILTELETQREPLREEAEVAQSYKAALGSLRQVETGLLVQELRRAVADIKASTERIESSTKLATVESNRAEKFDQELQDIGVATRKLEVDIEAVRSAQHLSLTAAERMTGELRLAEQKLASLDELENTLGTEGEASEARLAEGQSELERAKTEAEADETAFTTLRRENSGSDEAAAKLSAELRELEHELEEAKRIETLRMKRAVEQAHRDERIRSAKRELGGIAKSEASTNQAVREAEAEEASAQTVLSELRAAVAGCQERLADWRKTEDESAAEVRSALAERAGLQGRIQGIEATIAAHEGLAQGPRAVMEAADRGELTGPFVPVGEAISAEPNLTLAIETALGGSVNDLIVDSEDVAKSAVKWLKENRGGRATFQPISLMRPNDAGREFTRLLNEVGVVGSASELVTCSPKHRPVIDTLLHRVLVTETLDDALRIARQSDRPFRRIVTLGGEVVQSGGSVTGGATAKQNYGLVQRKSDLDRLQTQLKKFDSLVGKAEGEAQRRAGERDAIQAELESKLAELAEADTASQDARRFADSMREEAQAEAKAKARLERELAEFEAAVEAEALPKVDAAAIEGRRHDLLKALAAQTADAEAMEARLLEAEQRRDQAKARFEAAHRRLEHLESSESQRARRLENLGPEREKLKGEVVRLTREAAAASTARGDAETKLQALQEKRREHVERSVTLAESAKGARESLQALSDSTHQGELVRTRAEGKRAAALERLLEEYGIGESEALSGPEEVVPADAAALVGRLRRELRAMGDVNLGAIEAYDRLTRRFDELSAQQADILQGIADVELSIAELDNLTRDKFTTTYEQARTHFASMVTRLFGGGEGMIELTDPKAILDSGIEITITLPGKKRQQLALLSGGERSLCAMAFLFALLEVKCSPLVVLDEVDAPLDGVNVERFARLLQDYSKRTQFIIITHNRETIAAAPMWLGVTMQEPGVSTLIPYRDSKSTADESAVLLTL